MKKITIIRSVLLFTFFLLMVAGSLLGYNYYKLTNVDTETLLETSLNNLAHRESYRFSLSSKIQLNNYTTAKTVIAGERDSKKNLHIWGKIIDTELELYQFADKQYRYNTKINRWVIWENAPLTQEPLLLIELLPEANFTSVIIKDKKYLNKEIDNGKIFHVYKITLEEDTHPASAFFNNFTYEIYIEAKSREIEKTIIKAKGKNSTTNTLELKTEFYDINEEFKLSPPN